MSEEIERQILEELRRVSRYYKWTNIIGACTVGALVFFMIVADILRPHSPSDASPWAEVSAAFKRYDLDRAIALAKPLAAKHSNDEYGYSYLAQIYLVKGDLANAETNYARAYEIFPSDDNEKNLLAIRKRRACETAGSAGPGTK